jgi:hypothetical protein
MKLSKSLIAAVVIATASLGASAAYAAPIVTPPQALDLVGTSAFFGDSFDINQMSNTFSDQFTFTVSGSPANLDAIVSSISRTASVGLDITGLSLYSGPPSSTGTLVMAGTSSNTGMIDVWTLTADNLAVGSYYLQVSGSLVSNTSGSYGGAMMLAPVPEPETYGMMLAGLGLVGFMARRRFIK